MAEIALRAYVKEIDDLVEHEQLDEAIAHSRHILETYPKHLDTYRLLGKAYLEAKRYGDAADLFQRVLSAIPDDFVAHIGMSIVREDEGNLDASIWHMERAFETNPANPAIQQELRRLIGKRDGLEPHKVRLTRGALARMYAHGELYPQAIAELRSALQEDQDRPDLQVLLANLYWRTEQKEQAAEVAQQILTKLPFCRDANRIAAGHLQATGRPDEATPSHRRLASLDPYAAFVENAMIDPVGIDAGSVHLEKLEWRPGHPVAAPDLRRPTWTDSLGAGLRGEPRPEVAPAAPEGPIPSWLSAEPPSEAPPPPPVPPPAPVTPQPAGPQPMAEEPPSIHPFAGAKPPAADIPPWMREAGWSESTGEAVEGPVSFTDDELASAQAPAGEGELAPASIPDWLKEIAPQQAHDAGAGPSALPAEWRAEGAPAAPEIAAASQPEPPPPAAAPEKGVEVPTWMEEPSPGATETIVTWLGDRKARTGALKPPPAPPAEPEPAVQPEQPDWLAQGGFLDEEPVEEPPAESEAPPAWLTGVAEAAASEEALSAEVPSWVSEETPEPAIQEEEEEERGTPVPQAGPEAPDWLRAIAEPGAVAAPSAEAEGDWLAGLSAAAAQSKPAESGGPEWLRGIGEPEEKPAGKPEQRTAPDWLRGLGGLASPGAPSTPAPAGPDWLREPPAPPRPAGAEPAGQRGAAADFDWLRGIGEQEAPPAKPEVPSAGSGDEWLRGLVEMGAEASGEQPESAAEWAEAWPEGEAEEAEAIPSETPDWLGRLAAEAPPQPERPGAVEEPSWLEQMASEGQPEAVQGPEWLSEIGGAPQRQPSSVPEAGDDWLKGLLDEASLPHELAQPAEEGSVEPDWFAQQPVEAAGEPEIGAEIQTRTTGWLREMGEEYVPPDTLEPPAAPDWLKEFEAAGTQAPKPTDQTIVGIRGGGPGAGPSGSRPPIGAMDASTAGELGEDDVQKWLEALASRQESGTGAGIEEAPPIDTGSFFPPAIPAEKEPLPEEAEEGIGWLEEMAGQPHPQREPSVTSWQPVEPELERPRAQQPPPTGPEEEEEVPDWLRSLAAESAPAEPSEEQVPAEEEGPDWLMAAASSTVVTRTPVQPPEPPLPPAPLEEPEAPEEEGEWLRIPAEEAGAAVEPEPVSAAPAEFEEAPDWLLSTGPEPEPSEAAAKYEEEETGMPEWLRKAAEAPEPAEAFAPSAAPSEPIEEKAPEVPEAVAPTPAPPEPSWMRPSEPSIARTAPPETEIVVPEWLRVPVEAPKAIARKPEPVIEAPRPEPVAEPEVRPPAPPPVAPVVPTAVVVAPPPEAPRPAVEAPAATPRPAKARTTARTMEETLGVARQALATNDMQGAAKHYGALIRRRSLLDDVVADLQAAVERLPDSPELWQALGDAYMKADRAADAVEAYRHGLANL